MGSVSDIFTDVIGFFTGLIGSGSAGAEGFLEAGSTAANGVYGTVLGSLGNITDAA